jgi:hypothetical protein
MAGEAKTSTFLLGSATVMIGPVADLWDMEPSTHSIGLVKNFSITAAPTYTELTQGTKNQLVYSVLTDNKVTASMEVYEYTAKNLSYGLGLDGSALETISLTHVSNADVVGDGTIATVVIASVSDIHADFPVGGAVMVQELGGTDQVHIAKTVSATYASTALTLVLDKPFPDGVTFHSGSLVSPVNTVAVGAKTDQPFLAAKVVGILPQNNEPCVILMPKLRISKGFTLAFQTNQFGNLPFEFEPYELTSVDANYAEFAGQGVAKLYART